MSQPKSTKMPSAELSLDQQIAYLRKFGEVWPLRAVAVVSALIAVVCVYAFSQSEHVQLNVFLLFAAGVSGLLAVAIAIQLPEWRRAARATRGGRRVQSSLKLTVDCVDSENVVISGEAHDGSAVWHLQFSKPIGWMPESGEWPCKMVMLSGEPVPALIELEHGLLVPTRRSRRTLGGCV